MQVEFLKWFAWRSFAFTLVANQAVTPLIGLAVWSVAMPGQGVTSYYVAMLLVRLLTVSYENHTFSGRVYEGAVADDLLRPNAVVLAPLGENLAIRVWHIIIGLPVIVVLLLVVDVDLGTQNLAVAIPAVLVAAVLRFLYTWSLALSAFWTERAHSAVGFGSTLVFLLGGEAAPVYLLPDAIRPWAEALPFRAMSGFPAELAAGLVPPQAIAAGFIYQLLWTAVFAVTAAAVWRAGVRRYTAVGG